MLKSQEPDSWETMKIYLQLIMNKALDVAFDQNQSQNT